MLQIMTTREGHTPRYITTDHWIQESIKQIFIIQFWAVWGSWGCREKKSQTALSMLLLRSIFLCFQGQKIILEKIKKNPSVRTEKLHNMNPRKILKKYIKE